mmetsp:Transcript_40171/g.106300  ORF Transcript_40171/g.106300 Transcript_40171/m.106300 type:complete len:622 (+) Transcript_40171:27-1892(+)
MTSDANERTSRFRRSAHLVRFGQHLKRAQGLGRPNMASTSGYHYFVDVLLIKRLAVGSSELLLLPWEIMRKMGVLCRRQPAVTEYTFISHQWQHISHPWPDLLQLTEHMHLIRTPFAWVDWFCVPQWSRGNSSIADCIFTATMASFPTLCYHAVDAITVLKRCDGLRLAEVNLGAELLDLALKADAALAKVRQSKRISHGSKERLTMKSSSPIKRIAGRFLGGTSSRVCPAPAPVADTCEDDPAVVETSWSLADVRAHLKPSTQQTMTSLARRVIAVGVDLEYGVRAWCTLECVYLPDCTREDTRIERLSRRVARLRRHACISASTFATERLPAAKMAASALLNAVARVETLIELCHVSAKVRRVYTNAWSYHWLRVHVLRITYESDWRYLDRLFVQNTEVAGFGNLYLQSLATHSSLAVGGSHQSALDSGDFYWPDHLAAPRICLCDLVMSTCSPRAVNRASQEHELATGSHSSSRPSSLGDSALTRTLSSASITAYLSTLARRKFEKDEPIGHDVEPERASRFRRPLIAAIRAYALRRQEAALLSTLRPGTVSWMHDGARAIIVLTCKSRERRFSDMGSDACFCASPTWGSWALVRPLAITTCVGKDQRMRSRMCAFNF